jgi:hypothetical protein
MLSIGASFTVLIPSAFVTLSVTSLEGLLPLGRLRIIAAGPFHNLVFWCLLVATGKMGLGRAMWSVSGYQDVSSSGRVVITVDKVCNLSGFSVRVEAHACLGFSPPPSSTPPNPDSCAGRYPTRQLTKWPRCMDQSSSWDQFAVSN